MKPQATIICNYAVSCNGTGNCEKCQWLKQIKVMVWNHNKNNEVIKNE